MPIWHRTAAASRRPSPQTTELKDYNEVDASKSELDGHAKSWSFMRNMQRYVMTMPLYKKLACLLVLVAVALVCIHFLVLHEYAWVYQRCLLPWIIPTTEKHVVCQEAWSHMVANYDAALLWPPELVLMSARQQEEIQHEMSDVRTKVAAGSAPSVKDVHYTLTAPMSDSSTRDLGKCSVEAMARLCTKDSCRVNIWVVDQAAASITSELNESVHKKKQASSVVTYLEELVTVMESTGEGKPPPQYCIRLIHDPPSFDERSHVSPLFRNMTAGCPQPTPRSLNAGKRMREWLGSHQAREKQIPEHASDAWRLVALLEWGGLYVDMDVLPLSPLLLRIPQESVPVQHRVGAYRINGGVLRLGDGDKEDEAWATVEGMQRSKLRKRLYHEQSSFMKALEDDHMYWAPRLSHLPAAEQTFGFLGPAALTRVFSAHSSYKGKVTVLPKEVVEPVIGASLCREVDRKRSLAAHFSGKTRKKTWRTIMKRDKCLEDMMLGICPQTIAASNAS